jgi:hypothetical protein
VLHGLRLDGLRAARERPSVPILALTPQAGTGRRLAVVWGCTACSPRTPGTSTTWCSGPAASRCRKASPKVGERIIITAGVPLGTPGKTNMLRIAVAAPRPAMPGTVEEKQFGAPLEKRPQRHHLVEQIAAGPMQEDDRRQFRRGGGSDMDKVHPRAVHLGEGAGRRAGALDCGNAGAAYPEQDEGEAGKDRERDCEEVHSERFRDKGCSLAPPARNLQVKCPRRPVRRRA